MEIGECTGFPVVIGSRKNENYENSHLSLTPRQACGYPRLTFYEVLFEKKR